MTNEQIILANRVFLMEEGVIKGTGERFMFEDEHGKREIEVPEEIHTFQEWKRLGFQVQKGERSVARFPIWIYNTKKAKTAENGEDEPEKQTGGHCYMKMSFFFTRNQVKQIVEAGG